MKDRVQSTSHLQRLSSDLIQPTVVERHQLDERHRNTEHLQGFSLFGSLEDDHALLHILLEPLWGIKKKSKIKNK